MTEPLVIGIGTTKWVKESTTKMITLSRVNQAGTITLQKEGVDYQVPTGKKFVMLKLYVGGWHQYAGVIGSQIYKNSTAGTTTGATSLCDAVPSWGQHTYDTSAGTSMNQIETYIEIEAGQYLISTSYSQSASVVITGVETDA